MTPEPHITTAEVLRMHRENGGRMDSIEAEQRLQNRTLADMQVLLGRIDERTKRYDQMDADVECVVADLNKAKGAWKAGGLLLGAGELLHTLWGFMHGK